MATKCVVNKSTMTDIADAIRTKGGASAPLKPGKMAAAIEAIPSGGRVDDPEVVYDWDPEKMDETVLVFQIDDDNITIQPLMFAKIAEGHESFVVDWGDGSPVTTVRSSTSGTFPTVSNLGFLLHTYDHAGRYVVRISNDIATLNLTGCYSSDFNDPFLARVRINTLSSLVKVCKIGNLASCTSANANGNGFLQYAMSCKTVCAINPISSNLNRIFLNSGVSCCSIYSLMSSYAFSQSGYETDIKNINLPNVKSTVSITSRYLTRIPSDIVLGDGAQIVFASTAIEKDQIGVFDDDGNLVGGLAHTISPRNCGINLTAVIRELFDDTTPLVSGVTERETVERAFLNKGWTLVW